MISKARKFDGRAGIRHPELRGQFGRACCVCLLVVGTACGGDATTGSSPAQPEEPARRPPDLVLIMVDTLRPDHLGPYGYERETAPFLAQLARDSWIWTRAFSTSSWTAPSTASLLTGLYPTEHGLTEGFHNQKRSSSMQLAALPPAIATLPECLASAGYRTFGVAGNINVGPELGFDRGFDRFARLPTGDANELIDTLLGWRGEIQGDAPTFIYAHFNDVHAPLKTREPWFANYKESDRAERPAPRRRRRRSPERDLIARYDSEISYLDQALERLTQEIPLDQDTILMLVSDHGEGLGDHGDLGHGFSLYFELNRVLMMLHAPGLGLPARSIDLNVSLIDVRPTLLALAGVADCDANAPAAMRGKSLLPLLDPAAGPQPLKAFEQRTVFAHRVTHKQAAEGEPRPTLWAAMRGRWKLIYNELSGKQKLYDLIEDPAELEDRAAQEPARVAALMHALDAFRENSTRAVGQRVEIPLDEDLAEHLEALGYGGSDDD